MAVKLAPTRQFYFDQLRILLKHMASTGAFSTQDLLSQEKSLNSVTESLRGVQRKKVLVVEDSTTTRKVISITLRQNGFETIEAGDGLEALSKLNEVKPDLILLDIILPKMDGYKTLSILKRSDDFKHIPVIMLTSRDKLLDKIKGKMSGSEEYLTKFRDFALIGILME
jgi:twitching motility two-component system response regulator PilG